MASSTINKPVFDLATFNKIGIASADMNAYTTPGVFYLAGSPSHSPYGNYGVLIVLVPSINESTVIQLWLPSSASYIYYRRLQNSVWTNWFRVTMVEQV